MPTRSTSATTVKDDSVCDHSSGRGPLAAGTHFEIEVRDPNIKWRGIVDYLNVGDKSCVIKDFKTGEPTDDHILQLRLYALLWAHDKELNPDALPVSQMTICYPFGEKNISVDQTELAALSTLIATRASNVRTSIDGPHSRANVSNDHCPNCDVRHLCSDYWLPGRHGKVVAPNLSSSLMDDIEVGLKTRKGDKTWLAECVISNHFPPKSIVLLRWSSPCLQLLSALAQNMRVRFAGALVTTDEDTGFGIVHCLANTDIILLDA